MICSGTFLYEDMKAIYRLQQFKQKEVITVSVLHVNTEHVDDSEKSEQLNETKDLLSQVQSNNIHYPFIVYYSVNSLRVHNWTCHKLS